MADFGTTIKRKHKLSDESVRLPVAQGPHGPLLLRDLPASDTQRWVVRRKAEVVAAIRGGLLSRDEAMARYRLTDEVLANWERLITWGGFPALRTTRIQQMDRKAGTALEALESASALDSVETFGNLTIDYQQELVTTGGRNLHLSPKEYRVLELTILLRPEAVPKEVYLDYLYRGTYEPEFKIIDVFICKLRKKLRGATGADFIERIWGLGYKFTYA